MTATVARRTAWRDANGQPIELVGQAVAGKWVAKHDAALASLIGGPADGRGAVMLRGSKPPAIVGKRIGRGALMIAWYRRDDGPPKLTYRFVYTSPSWPTGGAL